MSSHNSEQPYRRKFTQEEDAIIFKLYQVDRHPQWDKYASFLPNRTERQCRERFRNYLDPNIQNREWSNEEDKLLEEKVLEYGLKWVKITAFFPGRSANNVKNRWYRHVIKNIEPCNFSEKLVKRSYRKQKKNEKSPEKDSDNIISDIFSKLDIQGFFENVDSSSQYKFMVE